MESRSCYQSSLMKPLRSRNSIFMEKFQSTPAPKSSVTRRGFLGGLFGAGAVAATHLPELTPVDEEDTVVGGLHRGIEVAQQEYIIEGVEAGTDSAMFDAEVARYADRYAEELRDREQLPAVGALIKDYFVLPGLPPVLRATLEERAVAFSLVESGFALEAESGVGAFGPMQIMPATWNELSDSGEEKHDVTDQIKVAARLVEQTYRHITSASGPALEYIKHVFYNDDEAAFMEQFLAPALCNAYNAGMGSLATMINRFPEEVQSPLDTAEMFDQGAVMTGFDVFLAMAYAAHHGGWAPHYKAVASEYTAKVYGAHEALKQKQLV